MNAMAAAAAVAVAAVVAVAAAVAASGSVSSAREHWWAKRARQSMARRRRAEMAMVQATVTRWTTHWEDEMGWDGMGGRKGRWRTNEPIAQDRQGHKA